MMLTERFDPRLLTIANELTEQTKARKLVWKKVESPFILGEFICSFSSSKAIISKNPFMPSSGLELKITNDKGVEIARANQLNGFPAETLQNLYNTINGSLKKVDETLDSLLDEIKRLP